MSEKAKENRRQELEAQGDRNEGDATAKLYAVGLLAPKPSKLTSLWELFYTDGNF